MALQHTNEIDSSSQAGAATTAINRTRQPLEAHSQLPGGYRTGFLGRAADPHYSLAAIARVFPEFAFFTFVRSRGVSLRIARIARIARYPHDKETL